MHTQEEYAYRIKEFEMSGTESVLFEYVESLTWPVNVE